VRFTASTRILDGAGDLESARNKQRRHGLFLPLHAEIRDGVGEILYSEETACSAHHGDAHRIQARVENILSVAGRIHPSTVNGIWIRSDGDVLGDDTKARTGSSEALFKIGFVGELVLELIQIDHAEGMQAGGFEERVVPSQNSQGMRGALAVQRFEELALRIVFRQQSGLRANDWGKKK
jgi:hypothetical protein